MKKKKCSICKQYQHAPDCIANVKNIEPDVIIPEGVGEANPDPITLSKFLFYMPVPNTTDDGFYFTPADLEKLLKANMYNPKAIEYIAEMVDDHER